MAFRFTPPCCCGGGCWRIPECGEIFKGFINYPAHLRDSDNDVAVDNSYLFFNTLATYNVFNNDCDYFDVITKDKTDENTGITSEYYFARNTQKTFHEGVYGNHILNWVKYQCLDTVATNARFIVDWDGFRLRIYLYQEGIFATPVIYTSNGTPRTGTTNGINYDGTRSYGLWRAPRVISGANMTQNTIVYPVGGIIPETGHLAARSYDGYLHSKGTAYYHRIFCLPFNKSLYPLPWSSNDTEIIETTEVTNINGLYIPIHGNGGTNCNFSWDENCEATLDHAKSLVFSSKTLYEELEARNSGSSNRRPVLDQYIVRLYGFTSPVWDDGKRFIDTVHGAEFAVTFVKKKSGTQQFVIMGDITTKDFDLNIADIPTDEQGNTLIDKTNGVDYPYELLYYSGLSAGRIEWYDSDWNWDYASDSTYGKYYYYLGKWAVRINNLDKWSGTYSEWIDIVPPIRYDEMAAGKLLDSRVIFGSDDTSALNGNNTPGSSEKMPTNWHSPKPTEKYLIQENGSSVEIPNRKEDNDINNRFHGIYWVYAQIAPCRNEFKQEVTHGVLYRVPVVEFTVKNDEWGSTVYNDNQSSFLKATGIEYESSSQSFSYASPLHQAFYPHSINPILRPDPVYIDEQTTLFHWRSSVTTRPYIIKPDGWQLSRLVWRVFNYDLSVFGGDTSPSTNLKKCLVPQCYLIGDRCELVRERIGEEGTITKEQDVYMYRDNGYLFPYDEEKIGFTGIGGYVPGGSYTDTSSLNYQISRYAYDNDYNLIERSVNGSYFKGPFLIDDQDDSLYGKYVYFPYMIRDQVKQLLARKGSLDNLKLALFGAQADAIGYDEQYATNTRNRFPASSPYTYYENVRLYVCFDFSYIAVWTQENQS